MQTPEQNNIQGVTPGCYALRNTNEQYHSDRVAVSSTWLKNIQRSPAHLKEALDHPREATDAMELGTALHAALLEPADFDSRYAVYTGAGNRRSKEYTEFVAAAGDKKIIRACDHDLVTGMRRAVMAYPIVDLGTVLANATRELSIYWTDEETGLQCRCRPDAFSGNVVPDVKKTTDARPWSFEGSIIKYGYDIQAAFYTEGLRRFLGRDDFIFIFIAVEEDAPHGVWLYEASTELLEMGREKYRRGLELYKQCKEKDDWPCYANPYSIAKAPRWAKGL